jgi:apolipoprotein N-acyltransferase
MSDDRPAADSRPEATPWWRLRAEPLAAGAVFVLTAALTLLSFPPFHVPECAYVFAVPATFWAYRRPRWKIFAGTVLGAQAVAWTIILGWLHHVTWLGLLLLGPFVGVWAGLWFLAARWALPRLPGRAMPLRVLAVFGLAGMWSVNEWTRTWLLGGFPWLPLAASQWQRVSILQIAAFTGAGGVSFVLVAMSLGLAAFAHRLGFENARGLPDARPGTLRRRSPEFLAALFLLIVCLVVHVHEAANRAGYAVPLARVAFVQPDIPQEIKWDPAKTPEILATLDEVTRRAAATKPDLILWPEATTPWALNHDPAMRELTEKYARDAGCPLVLGSIAVEPHTADAGATPSDEWRNASFVVDPVTGVQPSHYAKRKLVPFGEFVPLRPLLGWIGKFVPIGDDFARGTSAAPLAARLPDGRSLALGPLICYEDIFPGLARAGALAGADVLLVQTNNAWFGEGGAAYQHAANAVLRAIETRRPVLRDGNAGWSGWIDEFGVVRAVLMRDAAGNVTTDPMLAADGTIYFRGTATANVTRDSRWVGQQSFYTLYGDWFIAACAALALAGFLALRRPPT